VVFLRRARGLPAAHESYNARHQSLLDQASAILLPIMLPLGFCRLLCAFGWIALRKRLSVGSGCVEHLSITVCVDRLIQSMGEGFHTEFIY